MRQFHATETVNYDQLNEQWETYDGDIVPWREEKGIHLFRAHLPWNDNMRDFDFVITMWRHPLDSLISSWKVIQLRNEGEAPEPNDYVMLNIKKHIKFYKSLEDKAYFMGYESMWRDAPQGLRAVVELFGQMIPGYDDHALWEACSMSTFERIRKMGRDTGRPEGNHSEGYKGEFTRDGTLGQFYKYLKPEIIEQCEAMINA